MNEPIVTPAPDLSTDDAAFAAFDKLLEPTESTPDAQVDPSSEPVPESPAEPEPPPIAAGPDRGDDGKFKPKPRSDPQARIDEITAKHRTAERERDDARAELARLRTPPAAPVVSRETLKAVEDPEPNANDTEKYPAGIYDEAYQRDRIDWGVKVSVAKALEARDAAQARERQFTSVEAKMLDYGKRISKDFKTEADLEAWKQTLREDIHGLQPTYVAALINPNYDPKGPLDPKNVIADRIIEFDHPNRAIAYLNEHYDDFQRLLTLPMPEILHFMGRLDERLTAAPARPASEPITSNARPPIQRVESAPIVADSPPGDDAPVEEHFKYWNRVAPANR